MDKFKIIRLKGDYELSAFDCGDSDLNDYFINNASKFQQELLSVTYILVSDVNKDIIAFFSLLNDKITAQDFPSKNQWRKNIMSKLPHRKHFKSYPAVKIGRLGVDLKYQSSGIGKKMLDFIKVFLIESNNTGCKFITVDAYAKSVNFYHRNGFIFFTEEDANSDTRAMYFDLSSILK